MPRCVNDLRISRTDATPEPLLRARFRGPLPARTYASLNMRDSEYPFDDRPRWQPRNREEYQTQNPKTWYSWYCWKPWIVSATSFPGNAEPRGTAGSRASLRRAAVLERCEKGAVLSIAGSVPCKEDFESRVRTLAGPPIITVFAARSRRKRCNLLTPHRR